MFLVRSKTTGVFYTANIKRAWSRKPHLAARFKEERTALAGVTYYWSKKQEDTPGGRFLNEVTRAVAVATKVADLEVVDEEQFKSPRYEVEAGKVITRRCFSDDVWGYATQEEALQTYIKRHEREVKRLRQELRDTLRHLKKAKSYK